MWCGGVLLALTNVTPNWEVLCVSVAVGSPRWKHEHSQLCRVSAPVLQPELHEGWLPPSFRVMPAPSLSPMFQLLLSPWAAIVCWVLAAKETVSSDMSLNLSVRSSFHRLCVHWTAKSVSEKWWGEKQECYRRSLKESVSVCVWGGRMSREVRHIWSCHMSIHRKIPSVPYTWAHTHISKWWPFLCQDDSISTNVWKCI